MRVKARNVDDVVNRKGALRVKGVKSVELVIAEMDGAQLCAPSGFGERQSEPDDPQGRQVPAVLEHRLRGHEVSYHDVDPCREEATCKVAGVVYADPLLNTTLVSIPGCGMASDYQVAEVVDIDHRAERAGPSHRECCGALTSGGRADEQQRYVH